jgi:lipopolysaccharide transport system permease protein
MAANPMAAIRDVWSHRSLIGQFTRREIEGRYRGSYLGLLWSFITPMIMIAVYAFVFGVVFKARWPQAPGGGLAGFALVMFAGQIAFQLVAEPVGRAANLITGVPNFVKKVVFPLQILPLSVVGAAGFHAFIAMSILAIASLCINGVVPWTFILVPFATLPLLLLGSGLSWFFASLGVYLRDVGFVVGVALQVLFFATPIFYPLSAVPEEYRQWLAMNPLIPGVELMRACMITGDMPGWATWFAAYAVGIGAAQLGYAWFGITRKGFADVV